jgi:hypothetical protein
MSTTKAVRWLGLLILIVLVAVVSIANAPAPHWACAGKAEGDRCELYVGPTGSVSGCGVTDEDEYGVCRLATTCTDLPETEVNECLYCQ